MGVGFIRNWWVMVTVGAIVALISLIWFAFIYDQREDEVRRCKRKLKEFEKWKKEHMEDHYELLKAYPCVDQTKLHQAVRPGSHPSAKYYEMRAEQELQKLGGKKDSDE